MSYAVSVQVALEAGGPRLGVVGDRSRRQGADVSDGHFVRGHAGERAVPWKTGWMPAKSSVDRAARRLATGRRVTVLTGAGISTDSGIPDFRGPQGVWTRDPKALRTSNLRDYLEDEDVRRAAWRNRVASPTWDAEPNAGHLALVELERQGRLRALLTQNIDGLHLIAGHSPELVVELHGTMRGVVCWTCGERGPMGPTLERVTAGDPDPRCLACGGILKSTTVSFGQSLDPVAMRRAGEAAADCDVLLAVGSTLSVHPAAGLVPEAARHGAAVVILNAGPTAYDHIADVVVNGSISEVLPDLVAIDCG
jgi:NAD-dependent deacetylase